MASLNNIPTVDTRQPEIAELLARINSEESAYKVPSKSNDDFFRDSLVGILRRIECPTEAEQQLLSDTESRQRVFSIADADHFATLRNLYEKILKILREVMVGNVYMPSIDCKYRNNDDTAYLVHSIDMGKGLHPSIWIQGFRIGPFNNISRDCITSRIAQISPANNIERSFFSGIVVSPDDYINYLEDNKAERIRSLNSEMDIIRQRINDFKRQNDELKTEGEA